MNENVLDKIGVDMRFKAPEPELQEQEEEFFDVGIGEPAKYELPKFLWYPYLPKGEIVCLYGKQNVGKGYACAAICSALTNGKRPLDDGNYKPVKVVYMSTEDKTEDIERRFGYSGADLKNNLIRIGRDKIYHKEGQDKNKIIYNISQCPEKIEKLIRHFNAELLFIDPIQNFLGVKNLNAAEDVGAALLTLMQIAERTGCCIVYTAHPSKRKSSDVIDDPAGSAEFTRKPRSVLNVIRDETGTDENRRVIVPVKFFEVPASVAVSLAFRIESVEDETIENGTEEYASPAKAYFTGYSIVTKDHLDKAASANKTLVEYLAETQIAMDTLKYAGNILSRIYELENKQGETQFPVYVSFKELKSRYREYFIGSNNTITRMLKPVMREKGYIITEVGNRKQPEHFGNEGHRCLKIEKTSEKTTTL